jgi:hypothetical protein
MELVQRYVAAVQRELPPEKRQDIGRELQANIMDQLDALTEQQGALSESDISAVLKQLGHPRTVAQQYVPPQPLISLGYMQLYKNTLFMVLGILFLLQVVESTSAWLSSSQMGLLGYLRSLAGGYLQDALLGFSSITVAYWLMSRQQPKAQSDCETRWQPEKLPAAEATWCHISLQAIFTDLATYIFLLIVIWYPLWLSAEQIAQSGLMLSSQVRTILQYSTPLIILGMLNSLWQLQQRFWSRQMLISNIVLNTLITAVIVYLANLTPLLQLNAERWHGVFELQQLEHSAMVSLFIIALFPAWEVIRDVLRLRQLG